MPTDQEKLVDEHLERGCKFIKVFAGSYYVYDYNTNQILEITSEAEVKAKQQ